MDRSRSPRVLQPLTVGDTLTMPNGGVGVVTQIQGDQVTAAPFQWPERQRPVTREVFFNGSMSAAMAMQTPLSDEARLLQRLAEPELPPGATDAERAATRAVAAAEVEAAVDKVGGEWAHAYQELRPDW